MNSYQLLTLLCLLFGIVSCTTEERPTDLDHSDLIGHWNITLPSGLQFIEFIPNNRVLIGDRGALGQKDLSKHYLEAYTLTAADEVVDLPLDARMENITIVGNRMTFDFVNPTTTYRQPYVAYRVAQAENLGPKLNALAQTWITTEENDRPLKAINQKLVYFSKAGIYALKSNKDEQVQIFSWYWGDTDANQLCYSRYQRPTFIPEVSCMNFGVLTDSEAVFEVEGDIIRMETISF